MPVFPLKRLAQAAMLQNNLKTSTFLVMLRLLNLGASDSVCVRVVSAALSRDFVLRLCDAQAHRWELERLLMILTAYLDESGTHGGSPTTMLAGVMGSPRQWARFQTDIDRLKRQYGFTVFHAKEFRAASGQFKGWSQQKCEALYHDLFKASSNLTEAVTCSLPNTEFSQHYRIGEKPNRLRLDMAYGICFRYVVTHFLIETIRRFAHHKKFGETRLHIVAESGHKNAGDALRIFNEMKNEIDALGLHLLESVVFAGKYDADPLMIADYLAYGTLKLELDGQHGPDGDAYLGPPPKGTGLTHLQFTAEGLAALKGQLIDAIRNGGGRRAIFLAPPRSMGSGDALKVEK